MLKENQVKKKIKEGKLVLGSYCDPLRLEQIELMAKVGYDFVVLETEHGPYYGVEVCVNGVKTAESVGITPFIRVSHNNPVLIRKALEIGAHGVFVPHVDSKEECLLAVQAAKYPPDGTRGAGGSGTEEWKNANEQTMVTVLPLESKKGIDNIKEIISVKGLDMVSLSVGDITFALGYPNQPMHPEVMKVRDRICDLCLKEGMTMYSLGSLELMQYYYKKGVRVFMSGVNLQKAYQNHIDESRKVLK
jgi:4-hydroxy-2-oxoheptanedioate aldolase